MTWRHLIHYGLAAGLQYSDMHHMPPGLICDLYVMRQAYDDDQHGIRRKRQTIYD